jgi:hypothetical protein
MNIYKRPVCISEDIHLEMAIFQLMQLIAILKKEKVEEKIKLLTDYLKKYNGINVFLKILQLNLQSHNS